jgi:DNA protecting protein DprA
VRRADLEEHIDGESGDAELRQTCLWLAELASWRPDVVSRLVAACGSFAEVLQRSREEIAMALPRARKAHVAACTAPCGARPSLRAAAFADACAGSLDVDGADCGNVGCRVAAADDAAGPNAGCRVAGGGADCGDAGGDGAAWRAALTRLAPLERPDAPTAGVAVAYTDPLYPQRLKDLLDPPPAVFLLGGGSRDTALRRLHALNDRPCVAVVGTRKPTPYGLDMVQGSARDLAADGVVVISGLALGIDAGAHRGALDVVRQPGLATIAVVGCGADVCYPPAHRSLRDRILADGLLVSEFAWGTPARSWRFPARNRVMAALGDAVVVVEGATGSGALITARRGDELRRLVLAVPGESGRRLTEGPHELLRRGAAFCESGACVRRAFTTLVERDPDRVGEAVKTWLARGNGRDRSAMVGAEGRRPRIHGTPWGATEPGEQAADPEPAVPHAATSAHVAPHAATGAHVAPHAATGAHTALDAAEPATLGATTGAHAVPHAETGAHTTLDAAERAVLAAVDAVATGPDEIVAATGLSAAEVLMALGSLELRCLVAAAGGGRYRAVRGRR